MKKTILILLTAAAFIMSSCSPLAKEEAAPAAQEVKGPESVEAFGVVKAENIVNLTLNFSAPIDKVNVVQGQRVKRGETIITIDLKPLYYQIKEKEMELSNLKIEEEALEREMGKEWDGIPEALQFINDIKHAQYSYDEAVRERDVHKKLLESGGISQYEFDGYERTVEAKKKALEGILLEESKAKYSFDELKIQTGTKLQSLRGRMAVCESSIKELKDKTKSYFIEENNIIAAMENGLIYTIDCAAGDILTESKKAASLMDLDSLYVEANVNEEFIKDVAVGSDVLIIPEADKSREYKGKVTSISQGAFNINGQTSIPVHIKVEDIDDFLRPNYNVDVRILKK